MKKRDIRFASIPSTEEVAAELLVLMKIGRAS